MIGEFCAPRPLSRSSGCNPPGEVGSRTAKTREIKIKMTFGEINANALSHVMIVESCAAASSSLGRPERTCNLRRK